MSLEELFCDTGKLIGRSRRYLLETVPRPMEARPALGHENPQDYFL